MNEASHEVEECETPFLKLTWRLLKLMKEWYGVRKKYVKGKPITSPDR